ncbi:MAG: response regulator [Terriglobales bacterium]
MKVLLADDNITAQRMGSKILSDAGYTVVAVSNGAAAVKKIAAEKPELIILDVYMPGYTGLEVCDKVKSAVETMRVPVLLTITNMEPYNAADGNRVKADGVLVKPFEATDLLSVVRKFEEKLHAPESLYEKTAKLSSADDEGDAEWKVGASLEPEPRQPAFSNEIAHSPVLGIEELPPLQEEQAASAPAAAVRQFAVDSAPVSHPDFDLNAAPAFDLQQHAEAAAPVVTSAAETSVAELPSELEFTSLPQAGEVEVAPAAELLPTLQESADEVAVVQDPALATDPSDFSQFTTRFGQEHPEDVPVGIAMAEPDQLSAADEPVLEDAMGMMEAAAADSSVVEHAADDHAADVAEPAQAEVMGMEAQDHALTIEHSTHEEAMAEIDSLLSEASHMSETGFSYAESMHHQFAGGATAAAPALEAEPGAEVGVDTQPVDLWPQMHPAEVVHQDAPAACEPELQAQEPALAAEVGVDTQPLDSFPPEPSEDTAEAAPRETEHAAEAGGITQKLVAQFAAELEAAQMEAPPEAEPTESPVTEAAVPFSMMDEQRVAEAVKHVLDRYKDEMISAIVRELKG